MAGAEIRFKGLFEIQRALNRLPGKMDKQLLEKGLVAGAMLTRDAARRMVPLLRVPDPRRLRGTLQHAITVARVRPDPGYRASVWVRVRPLTKRQIASFKQKRGGTRRGVSGADNPNDPFYWRFVEFGTSKMPARPFLRPGFESSKEAAVRKAIDTLGPLVEARLRELAR